MKKLIWSIAALFAIIALSSCSKDDMDIKQECNNEVSEERCIYATFDIEDETKTQAVRIETATDIYKTQPVFVLNDEIWISDGTHSGKGVVTKVADAKEGYRTHIYVADESINLDGDLYALYPYSAAVGLVDDGNGGNAVKYKIQEKPNGTFAQANICGAFRTNRHDLLKFKNLVAIMKVMFRSKYITSMVVNPKVGMLGEQTVSFTDKGGVAKITGNTVSKGFTFTPTSKGPFYFAMAPGVSYTEGEEIAKYYRKDNINGEEKNVLYNEKKMSAAKTLQRNKLYNMGAAVPRGIVEGLFSVSSTKKYVIAKGNYHLERNSGTAKTWYGRNYPEQYMFNSKIMTALQESGSATKAPFTLRFNGYNQKVYGIDALTNDTQIDLLMWSSQYTNPTALKEKDFFSSFVEWGKTLKYTKDYDTNFDYNHDVFVTPTRQDFDYLFNTRSGERFFTGRIKFTDGNTYYVNGLFLLPDEGTYDWPAGVRKAKNINGSTDGTYSDNTYTLENFHKLENAGIVFLPASGHRGGTETYKTSPSESHGFDSQEIVRVNFWGNYWTKTIVRNSNNAWSADFNSTTAVCNDDSQEIGRAIRLFSVY